MKNSLLRTSLPLIFIAVFGSPKILLGDEPASGRPPASEKSADSTTQNQSTNAEPFAFADFSWLNGNSRQKYALIETKYFTGQFQVDTNYTYSFNRPKDHTIDGVCEVGRHNEVQVTQLGVGGDFHYSNVRGRLMTQFGLYSQMTPRNDASPLRGQWNLDNAYRYISRWRYHLDVLNGINIDAGIFMSYVGLFSYYQFENWAYSPSYVSANTPWFFNGIRVQIFPSDKLKLEAWLINGWQSYGMFNETPGLGAQILWRPSGKISLLSNNYWGYDTLGNPNRMRVHTDNSFLFKYHDSEASPVSKAALSVTVDAGCESGGGVSCFSTTSGGPAQNFLGFMVYHRLWFAHDLFGLTVGGGAIHNPGRYLVLLPPINGATASSAVTNSPYFSQNPGDEFSAWDASLTFDYMPNQFVTLRAEYNHRQADINYFVGSGGVTPTGGNTGDPTKKVDGFNPNLVPSEDRITLALLVRL